MIKRGAVVVGILAAVMAGVWIQQALSGEAPAPKPPIVKVHEGKYWIWYARQDQYGEHQKDIERFFDYADQAFEYLTGAWGLKPRQEKYALLVWPQTGGGFAAGDIGEVRAVTGKPTAGIGVSYDAFFNEANGVKGYWGYVLIAHEMTNLLTGQIVSGGWPVDWWADHVSPFPLMTAVQIEYALVPEVAIHHAKQQENPLGRMFLRLKDQFGWALFRRAFAAAIEDGIQWDRFGANPSALRTNMVCAYLQLAAPEDLASYFKGVVPNFDAKTVAEILQARQKWRALPEGDPKRADLQKAYLRGEYRAAAAGDELTEGMEVVVGEQQCAVAAPATNNPLPTLEFRIVPSSASMDSEEQATYREWLKAGRIGFWWEDGGAPGVTGRRPQYVWLPKAAGHPAGTAGLAVEGPYEGKVYMLVSDKPGECMPWTPTGKDAWGVAEVRAEPAREGDFPVLVRLNAAAVPRFSAMTKANVHLNLAIIVGGEVVSAPVLMTGLTDTVLILGVGNKAEQDRLVSMLKTLVPGSPHVAQTPPRGTADMRTR